MLRPTDDQPTPDALMIGRDIRVLGDTMTMTAASPTGGYVVFDLTAEVGAPPLHTHPWEEVFHVVEGTLKLRVGDRLVTLRPGEAAAVPGGMPHTYRAAPRARVVVVLSGLDSVPFFAEIDGLTDIDAVIAVAARHGVVPCGPPIAA